MLLAMNRLSAKGKTGMINMHSWMFLDAFEDLRKQILSAYHLDNMLEVKIPRLARISPKILSEFLEMPNSVSAIS